MSRQSTTPPEDGADTDAPALVASVPVGGGENGGGKARSLGRLAALGLPVPPACAVTVGLWRAVRANGPAVPAALAAAEDLTALDAARAALEAAPWPAAFEEDLQAAVVGLSAAAVSLPPTDGFAVRSSGDTEDRDGTLAPGLYRSLVRVPAAGVAAAVRAVLSSYLTPAALVYATRHLAAGAPAAGGGVLIHPFVVGTSSGTCALGGPGGEVVVTAAPDARAAPTPAAMAVLQAAARAAFAAHGPSELEWVSADDRVVFLQLRAYRAPHAATEAVAATPPSGWTWDAAHNPAPLSPAQAGLVELVDARCQIGLRQRVVDGYLYYAPAQQLAPADLVSAGAAAPAAVFHRVRADVERLLAGLGDEASLPEVLDAYVAGYQALYGTLGPVLAHARTALTTLLATHLRGGATDAADLAAGLLAGVPSVVDQRREAAAAIATAGDAATRQAAIQEYLARFGDESATWDVAAPTLREAPAPVLAFADGAGAAATSTAPPGLRSTARASSFRTDLPATERPRFDAVWTAAREAAAAGEDDDALFARLQAAVRRALLRLGHLLHTRGQLDAADDVFLLPLSETVAQARPSGRSVAPDLRALVAANRAAWEQARHAPPAMSSTGAALAGTLRGRGGSSGRAIGRVVHHPPGAPLGPNSILVAATLLPTELPLLTPGGIVVETGGVLGHVAAQARERGLPAVVGAAGARIVLPEGVLAMVDGDRGEVHRLS